MEFDNNGIAIGSTTDDKKQRKQFIIEFYGQWIKANPEKRLYNNSLKAFIEVRFLSVEETAGHASTTYKSTVAVTFLSEIVENALVQKDKMGNTIAELPKPNVKNQSRFSKLFIMEYEKADFGKIKLTVGELRGSGQKIQYCITAIGNG
jgi:sulfatase maturation enzyme AslB (radical SAM superfamily)